MVLCTYMTRFLLILFKSVDHITNGLKIFADNVFYFIRQIIHMRKTKNSRLQAFFKYSIDRC